MRIAETVQAHSNETAHNALPGVVPIGRELQQLRDIHPPAPVSSWPPAPGWWLLAICVAVALLLLARRLQQRRQRRAPYVVALSELDRIAARPGSVAERTQEVAVLLRRMALLMRPEAAALPAEQLPMHLFGVSDEWLVSVLTDRFAPSSARQPATTAELHGRLRTIIRQAMHSTR